MEPQIKISVHPAPLGEIMTAEFAEKQRKLVAMYEAAPEMLAYLKKLFDAGVTNAETEKMRKVVFQQ